MQSNYPLLPFFQILIYRFLGYDSFLQQLYILYTAGPFLFNCYRVHTY